MNIYKWLLKIIPSRKNKAKAFNYGLGAKQDPLDTRDHPAGIGTLGELPSYTSLKPYCSPVKRQGSANSCTAFAAINAYEMETNMACDQVILGSEAYNYLNSRQNAELYPQDQGSYLREACKVLYQLGNCPSKLMPYDDTKINAEPGLFCDSFAKMFKIKSYERIYSVIGIKQSLAEGHPVMIALPVFQEIFAVDDTIPLPKGTIPLPKGTAIGGHAMVIVSYDETTKCFEVLNSWGTNWGIAGYAQMPYDYIYKVDWFDAWKMTTKDWRE
jgi:C1A family cysteine protease